MPPSFIKKAAPVLGVLAILTLSACGTTQEQTTQTQVSYYTSAPYLIPYSFDGGGDCGVMVEPPLLPAPGAQTACVAGRWTETY